MLERSAAAKFATSVFFEGQNDFDVFIEDKSFGYSKLFAIILGRALNNTFKLDRVFPLGGRTAVVDAAKEVLHNKEARRKSIFIVDGDLYLLTGEREPLPTNVLTLPRYCIENFLLDENAIVELMDEEDPCKEKTKLYQELNFQGWITDSQAHFKKLFVLFAVSHALQSGIRTVSRGYSCVCSNSVGQVNGAKIDALELEIRSELIAKFGEERVLSEIENVNKNIDQNHCFISKYVSAKDFSLPLITLKLREITKTKASSINLKQRLAAKADTSNLHDIAQKIANTIGLHDLERASK